MKAVVLDRDGVINEERDEPVARIEDFVPIPGSLEAIGRLHQAGIPVAIATNQSGLSRGVLDIEALHTVHRHLHEAVGKHGGRIEMIAFCPHADATDCDCRKPAPGMLYTIADRLGVELTELTLIGDSLRDMQAALAAAAAPMIVRTGKGQQTLDSNMGLEHIPAFDDLSACVDALLAERNASLDKTRGAL